MIRPNEPDYIVIRDPDSPIDGLWYDRRHIVDDGVPSELLPPNSVTREYGPTSEFEVRQSDMAVAQVWGPVS